MKLKIELRSILFSLIILEMLLQLDLKAHTCLYKFPQLTVHVRAQTKP